MLILPQKGVLNKYWLSISLLSQWYGLEKLKLTSVSSILKQKNKYIENYGSQFSPHYEGENVEIATTRMYPLLLDWNWRYSEIRDVYENVKLSMNMCLMCAYVCIW